MKNLQYLFLFCASFFLLVGSAQAQIKFEKSWPVEGLPSGIDIDSRNNIYVSTNNQIIILNPLGKETQRWGEAGVANGQFSLIGGIAVDSSDSVLYATDSDLDRIQKFSTCIETTMPLGCGSFIQKWGTLGTGIGQVDRPQGIAVAPDGTVYAAEQGNHRVQHFGDAGSPLRLWGSLGYDENQFENPGAIAIGLNGHVFVGDQAGFIREFDASGNFIRRFGGQDPTPVDGLDDGRFGPLYGAYALAVDSAGLIYAVDRQYDRIQIFRPDGTFLTKLGSTGAGDPEFDAPVDIAAGPDGRVYVAERNNSRIQVFSTAAIRPANNFSFGKKIANRKKGTVILQVWVPGAGRVQLLRSSSNHSAKALSRDKSTVRLQVKARGKSLRKLRQKKSLTVRVSVRFTPDGGVQRTKNTRVTLRLR